MDPRLCLLVCVSLLSTAFVFSADTNVCISINSEINKQAILTIKCQLEQCKDVNSLKPQSIKISIKGNGKDILLASIEKNKNVASRSVDLGGTPSVSGSMKDNRNTYLAIEWDHADSDLDGQYSCVIVVTDKSGQRRTLAATTDVAVEVPVEPTHDPSGLPETLEECERKLFSANETIRDLEEKVKDLQQELEDKDTGTLDDFKTKLAKIFFQTPMTYNSKRYYQSLQPYTDDAQSDAACNIVGGYLAEVGDANELKAVAKYMKSNKTPGALISGTDELQEGVWLYQRSKKPVAYFNWALGEPNDANGGENCLTVFGDQMMDSACSENHLVTFPFICEVDK